MDLNDVLTPEVYWIGNRCFRRNPTRNGSFPMSNKYWGENEVYDEQSGSHVDKSKPAHCLTATTLKPYVEDEDYSCDPDAPDESEDNYNIEETDIGFKIRCDNIPASFFPMIVGKKGMTKSRIESETKTKLVIPRPNEKGDIVIRGRSKKDVINCRRRLDLITSQSRFKRDLTHFICLPLNSTSVISRMKEFKNEVLKECGASVRGVDDMIFVEPEKSHLTICVAVLVDEKERQLAKESLSNIQNEIKRQFNKDKLTIRLKGLEIMNDDPTQVDVLYAKCAEKEDRDIVQSIANLIAKRFAKTGFSKENRTDSVKLHCTIMNTRKRAEKLQEIQEGQGNDDHRSYNSFMKRETFDASLILSRFKDFDFGKVDIQEIKLATRFTTGPDGFYKSYCSVSL